MADERKNGTVSKWHGPDSNEFAVGNPGGPGRKKGSVNFKRAIAEKAAKGGVALEDIVWSVFAAMVARARSGDVQAAKLILDRICDPEEQLVRVTHGPVPPPSPKFAEYLSELAAISSELRGAAADTAELERLMG